MSINEPLNTSREMFRFKDRRIQITLSDRGMKLGIDEGMTKEKAEE